MSLPRIGMMAGVMVIATVLLTMGLHNPGLPGLASGQVVGSNTHPSTKGGSSTTGSQSPPASSGSSSSSGTSSSGSSSSSSNGTSSGSSPNSKYTQGPLLSSTPYASVSFLIYPGTPSAQASQAIDGFAFHFQVSSSGQEQMVVTAQGQTTPIDTQLFPAEDHLYFLETSMGDDVTGADLNGGDDNLILTDPQGHVLQ